MRRRQKHSLITPSKKTKKIKKGDEEEPEPEKNIDLFVEDIDPKDTLDCITVLVTAHTTQFEVTECHTRKVTSLIPEARIHQIPQRLQSEDKGLAVEVPRRSKITQMEADCLF